MELEIKNNLSSRSIGSIKVKTKVFVLIGFCLTLLALVAGTGIWQMNKIGAEIVGITDRDLPLTRSLTLVTIHQLEQAVELERSLRLGESIDGQSEVFAAYNKSVQAFEALTVKIDEEFKLADAIATKARDEVIGPQEREAFNSVLVSLEKLGKEYSGYDRVAKRAFNLIATGKADEVHALMPEIQREQEALNAGLEILLAGVEDFTSRAAETAEAHEIFALNLMLAMAGIAFTVGSVSAYFLITRSISRPLDEVVTGISALISGDLSHEVRVYNDDEIGAVAKACATFRENLLHTKELEAEQIRQKAKAEEEQRAMMNNMADEFDENVGGIVQTVSAAATELSTTAQSMAGIAEETSSQASSVAAASEEASTNMQTVASATEQMSASISEINNQVADASQAAQTAVENVAVTAGQMNELAKTADKIGDVVSIISDIAEQTNLLALNATIESARAGEAGKGFAVVASEVKALANETAKATESISEHISEIQVATREAVGSIDNVGKTIKQIEETSTAIAAAMQEQGIATQEVSRNVQEAASGTQEVSSNIAGVTEASQEAGAASGQVTSAAGELSQQAEMLKTEVDNFLQRVKAG